MLLKDQILWSVGFALILLFIHFSPSNDQCDPVNKACQDATYAAFSEQKANSFP